QWLMLGLNKISPSATAWVDQKATDLIVTGMEEPDMIDTPKSEWFGKMEDIDKGEKIDIRPGSRYLGIGRKSVPQFAWSEGVHIGSPKGKDADFGDFGTYDIAKHLGFTEEQAMRIAKSNNAVDTNETHYRDPHDPSKPRVTEAGSGGEAGDFHWHFNRAAKGEEDTRITAAKVHLERAVELTKDGYFNAAERELGIGLHGLQDVFAHSQITPLNHSLLGEFPDFVKYHPVGMYEAAVATEGYLRKFASAMNLSAANKDVAGTGQAGAGVARAGIQAPAAQSASAATISQKAQLAAQLVSGEGPQATTDKITRMVTAFPAGLVDFLEKNQISIVVGGPGFDPTALGFGADLDGDGAITAGKSIDVNQDGVLQGFEGEGNTANGVPWNEKMGGYNHANRTIFVAHEAAIDDKMTLDVLQHEVRHAIDSCFREDPALKSQWESYVGRIYEDDRRSGDLGFAQTDAREHVADH
ncbi:hypothetical protein KAI87_17620, partial [Myxococcota bacterium]|nr:hypothetical protein [Myxococcota bacterium]